MTGVARVPVEGEGVRLASERSDRTEDGLPAELVRALSGVWPSSSKYSTKLSDVSLLLVLLLFLMRAVFSLEEDGRKIGGHLCCKQMFENRETKGGGRGW